MAIRIFIYDDNKDRRESLKALISLTNNLKIVGEGANCKHVLQDMETQKPDVVLMDINMPEVDGLQGLIQIKTNFTSIQVLMQTAFDDDDKIFTSIKNGASGYLLKSDNADTILQAIVDVHAGGAVMNPTIAKKIANYFLPKQTNKILSEKEHQVLAYLSDGLSYKMIANQMNISYTTVNHHVKNIYAKLHISSLGEAIAYYYKNIK